MYNNKYKTTRDTMKGDILKKQHSKTDIQELMTDGKHLKHQQDIEDNKKNDDIVFTFHYYVEQNYVHPSRSLVFTNVATKKLHL